MELITFGDDLIANDDLFRKTKQRIAPIYRVYAGAKWETNIVRAKPLKIKIRNENDCRLANGYDLKKSDTIILNAEVAEWIKSGSIHLAQQQEIIVQSSNVFVVHRVLGLTPGGAQIIKSRCAIDFVALNDNSYRYVNEYDLTLEELQNTLSKYRYYNANDVSKYFYHILLDPDSKKYGGIVWKNLNGRKRVAVMDVVLHGLKDAPIYGHEIMATAYSGSGSVTVQDDIFGGGRSLEECADRFVNDLQIAHKECLILDPHKAYCCNPEINFVGFQLNSTGLRPLPRNKTKCLIMDVDDLCNYKRLRAWSGALQFISSWIPGLAEKVKRLKNLALDKKRMGSIRNNKALNARQKKQMMDDMKINMNEGAIEIVSEINELVRAAPLLHHIDTTISGGVILLKVDTSLIGTAASIWQYRSIVFVLCRFWSRALSPAQANYSATEREGLGVVTACEANTKVLQRHFFIATDHRALLAIFGLSEKITKNYTLIRFKWRMDCYYFTMTYIRGSSLDLAIEDYLSRYSKDAMSAKQARDSGIAISTDLDDCHINMIGGHSIELLYCVAYESEQEVWSDQEINLINVQKILDEQKYDLIFDRDTNEHPTKTQYHKEDREYFIRAIDTAMLEADLDPSVSVHPPSNVKFDADIKVITHDGTIKQFISECDLSNHEKNTRYDVLPYPLKRYDTLSYLDKLETTQIRDIYLMNRIMMTRFGKPDIYYVSHDESYCNKCLKERKNPLILSQEEQPAGTKRFIADYSRLNDVSTDDVERQPVLIAAVETRAQKKKRLDKVYQKILSDLKYKAGGCESMFTDETNIFENGFEKALETFHKTQHNEFGEIIRYLTDLKIDSEGDKNYNFSVNEEDYVKLCEEIRINEHGILTYKDRYIVPSKLRAYILRYYHVTATNPHRGRAALEKILTPRYFWHKMYEDIAIFVRQCPCRVAVKPHQYSAGNKDTGANRIKYALEQNQIVYLDLYGPITPPDGDKIWAITMIDAFDGWSVSEGRNDIKSIDIIKFILFRWIWVLGMICVLYTDNGSNLRNKLNKILSIIFGITRLEIVAYSPWIMGRVEVTNKVINNVIWIENMRREIQGLKEIRQRIGEAIRSDQYHALISTACLINNNTVKTHGYTPRQLRMNGGSNILLDVALRLKTVKHISHADYITEGVVDYDKFKDALSRINKFILEHAKETKLKHLNKRNLKNDEVIDITFKINDYVSYTAPPTAKKISRHKYGWQVIKRLDEKHFIIRNIFTSEQIKANYGHIKLFHKPLSSFKKSVENEITRLMNL
eukprot:721175_1